ncbi:DUF3137 domain-containing protein, partial [bacterium]|nr:DUF3137 domain-containing protein [bacterium]
VLFWNWIQKSFERKLKTEIMPYLMKAFQSFYWQDTPPVTHEEISKIKIFSRIDSARKSFDDCFVGKYRGVQVAISECHYETGGKNSVTIFNGAVIKLKMNKNFSGITVIRPTSVGWGNFLDLKKYKMNKVELEDVKFNEKYTVYSTDQVESRYLLTPTFMERFENISLAFSSSGCFCSFYGDSVYIAPYVSGDLFKLFSLWKPVTESKQFQVLFEEIVSILELVDHFKLDTRLGL